VPQVAELQSGGARETTFTTGEVTVVDVDDMDFGAPPPVSTAATAGDDGVEHAFADTPAHDALVKNKSFVRPLNEIAAELRPTPKNRRPHTADSRERPWSAGTQGTDDDGDDDDAVAAGAGSPASPSNPGAQARRRSTIRGGEELAKYAVSPNATINATSPNATINASALDGVASLTSPPSRFQPHDENSLSPGPLSPDSQTLVDRLTSALRQDAERLGDAPMPPGLAAAASSAGGDDGDDEDDDMPVEEIQRRKREAELDRRASIAITRAHSIMSPKSQGVAAPTPRSGGRPPLSPRGGPAGGVPNGSMAGPSASNMSFAGRPPPMDLGPAGDGGGSFVQPPALSNESIVWGASTVGGHTAQSGADATPRQLPATTSNFSFASASFALSPQQNSRRPPTESTAGSDSPNVNAPRPSRERADDGSTTGIAPPRALKPASVPSDTSAVPMVSTFSFAGTMMSMSSDGDGTDDEAGAPKLPDAPPPAALFETVKRMNDSTGGLASTLSPTSPAGASTSHEESLPRAKSVRFSADSPKSRAEAPTTAPSPTLPARRTASSMMSPKGPNAASGPETPKYGRRSSMASVKADRQQ
jgi:hypothetical protein